jgi:hypothetical protein
MVRIIRSLPTAGAPEFDALAADLTRWIGRCGFHERRLRGSVSWVSRSRGHYKTFFKLVNEGAGGMQFGVNKSVVQKADKLRRISWPMEFAVAPQSQVKFVGFRVRKDHASVDRVKRILRALEKPGRPSELSADYAQAERKMDEQLRWLTEAGMLAVASAAAAAAALPPEDFSDWER